MTDNIDPFITTADIKCSVNIVEGTSDGSSDRRVPAADLTVFLLFLYLLLLYFSASFSIWIVYFMVLLYGALNSHNRHTLFCFYGYTL